jgi:hypothetical protein
MDKKNAKIDVEQEIQYNDLNFFFAISVLIPQNDQNKMYAK